MAREDGSVSGPRLHKQTQDEFSFDRMLVRGQAFNRPHPLEIAYSVSFILESLML